MKATMLGYAAGFLLSSPDKFSVSSPTAILMTLTALPITSAGRRSPLGPMGISDVPVLWYSRDELSFHLRNGLT